ncbi:ATP-binding protein [Zongyangia hominis]|uniref:ATP-binding protein n=1 Tax=Zongyangia hominis TaxID=2763677 RepID=A0A926EDG6_9FIRM|nr:ATP-binding protein [Zongyangia hominis]MBC8569742.1 ATP-binding protein [Zongyangia hominis]
MGYPKEIHKKAFDELEARRRRANETAQRHRQEVLQKAPEVAVIDRQLSATALSVARAVLDENEHIEELIKGLRLKNLDLQKRRAALLTQAGFPADYTDIHYTCSRCQDRGYVGSRMCECLHSLQRQLAHAALCEQSAMTGCKFSTFQLQFYPDEIDSRLRVNLRRHMEEVLVYCQNYASGFSLSSPSVLMQGKTGLGKTHLSLAIASDVLEKGFGVIYMSAQNLLSKIERERFSREQNGDFDTFSMICDADLLILDDLGAEFSTQFTVSAIYNIINSRILSGKPTIINTNLTLSELKDRYTERVISRLMGTYDVLSFYGIDIRQLKRR